MTREEQILAASMSHADKAWKGEHEHAAFKTITMADFSAGATWADSHPHWIPVEEELPKENEEVLAYNAENEEVIACDYHHKMFHCWPEAFKESITHWMPMPQQPQGKEG